MVQLLKEKNRKALLNQDSIYEKIQKKKLGCLGRLQHALERENKESEGSKLQWSIC